MYSAWLVLPGLLLILTAEPVLWKFQGQHWYLLLLSKRIVQVRIVEPKPCFPAETETFEFSYF
jgi:hypothetical protein